MKIEQCRDASNRLRIKIFDLKKVNYSKITSKITQYFNLIPSNNKVATQDTIFQTYSNHQNIINIEWDNWSGYGIVAQNKESESLINEIYNWLLLEKLDF